MKNYAYSVLQDFLQPSQRPQGMVSSWSSFLRRGRSLSNFSLVYSWFWRLSWVGGVMLFVYFPLHEHPLLIKPMPMYNKKFSLCLPDIIFLWPLLASSNEATFGSCSAFPNRAIQIWEKQWKEWKMVHS